MKAQPLTVYLPDTRGVTLSRYGRGNDKIGHGVFTYSRLPGQPSRPALGIPLYAKPAPEGASYVPWAGTCPGSTPECESICYASRPVAELGPVAQMWLRNSIRDDVPPIPAEARLLRIHVSGDFDSNIYINNWILRLKERPDVTAWCYTRSWRVPALLTMLEELRALPNMQLFASMDKSTVEIPPVGWRRAWIDGDPRADTAWYAQNEPRFQRTDDNHLTFDRTTTYVCPEERGRVESCEKCQYCFASGGTKDVTFLLHTGSES